MRYHHGSRLSILLRCLAIGLVSVVVAVAQGPPEQLAAARASLVSNDNGTRVTFQTRDLASGHDPLTQAPACAWEARPADRLTAELLFEQGRRLAAERAWSEAAHAVEASAMLHPRCLEAIERFREAGRLFHYAGELEEARLAMIAAAERAVDLQDPALAAHAYLDAAELAQLMDDPGAAVLPIAAALELARSPALSEAEREGIARRLVRDSMDLSGSEARAAAPRGS